MSRASNAIRVALLLSLVAATVVMVFLQLPPVADPPFDLSQFGAFSPSKVTPFLHSLLALVLVNLAALGCGMPLARWLQPRSAVAVAPLVPMALGLLVLANAAFALAALGQLRPPLIVIGLVLAAGMGMFWMSQMSLPRSAFGWPWWGLAAISLSPFLAAFVPDYGWDAFVYHLAVPERCLEIAGLWSTPFSFYTAFPLTMQMLYAIALAIDPGPLTKLLHLEFGVLTVAAIILVARRYSPRASLLALVIVAADPLLVWEMGVAYADLTGCFFSVMAAVLLFRCEAGDRRCLFLSGLLAGATVAIHLRLAIVPAALIIVALWRWRSLDHRSLVRILALWSCGAMLVIAPWLVRNAVIFGNPVAPAGQSFFHQSGQEFFEPIVVEQSLELALRRGPGRSLTEFVLLPWRLTTASRADGNPLYSFQIGLLYLAALAAVVFSWNRLPDLPRHLTSAALIAGSMWFWSGAQESRYVLPVLLLLVLPGAVAIDRLLPSSGFLKWAAAALLGIAIVMAQVQSVRLLPWRWGYALGKLSTASMLAQEPALVIGERLRRRLPPEARLLLLFEGRAYFYRGLDFIPYHVNEGAPTLQLIHRSRNAEELHRRLEDLGVTHVLVNQQAALRYPTVFVAGYTKQDFARDLGLIAELLEHHSRPYMKEAGVVVRALERH